MQTPNPADLASNSTGRKDGSGESLVAGHPLTPILGVQVWMMRAKIREGGSGGLVGCSLGVAWEVRVLDLIKSRGSRRGLRGGVYDQVRYDYEV